MKKLLFIFFTFLCLAVQLTAQIQKEYECGTYKKDIIPLEPTHIDRFGNRFNQAELFAPLVDPKACDDLKNFQLDFKTTDPKNSFSDIQKKTICSVFQYLEKTIADKPKNKIRIEIVKTPLQATSQGIVLAAATPYYNIASCGISQTTIFNAMKGGNFLPNEIMGSLYIATAAENAWHYPVNDKKPPLSTWIDLYSVTLHEALHILAFASNIDPLTGFPAFNYNDEYSYSRWDEFLYKKDVDKHLLEILPSDVCCEQKDYAFKDLNGQSLIDNCKSEVWFRDQTDKDIVKIACHKGDVGGLSHLFNACTTNDRFVMHPYSYPNDTIRKITEKELNVLCAYGYKLVDTKCEVECEAFALQDNLPAPYYLNVGSSATVNVIQNDIYSNKFDWEVSSYDSQGIDVVSNQSTGEITITAIKNGEWNICYKLTSCDGKKCMNSCFKVLVIDPNLDKCCDKIQTCNISCLGDFEVFTSTFELRHFLTNQQSYIPENQFVIKGTPINTVDLLFKGANDADYCHNNDDPILENQATEGANGTEKYLGFWAKKVYQKDSKQYTAVSEGFALPLCKKVLKKTKAKVKFWAKISTDCNAKVLEPEIEFSFISTNPLPNSEANHSSSKSIKIDKNIWTQYEVNFEPNEGEDGCFLLVSGIIAKNKFDSTVQNKSVYFHIDEIKVIYDEQFSVEAKTLPIDCKNNQLTIEYTVCNKSESCSKQMVGTSSPQMVLDLTLPTGVGLVPGNGTTQFSKPKLTVPSNLIPTSGRCNNYYATLTNFPTQTNQPIKVDLNVSFGSQCIVNQVKSLLIKDYPGPILPPADITIKSNVLKSCADNIEIEYTVCSNQIPTNLKLQATIPAGFTIVGTNPFSAAGVWNTSLSSTSVPAYCSKAILKLVANSSVATGVSYSVGLNATSTTPCQLINASSNTTSFVLQASTIPTIDYEYKSLSCNQIQWFITTNLVPAGLTYTWSLHPNDVNNPPIATFTGVSPIFSNLANGTLHCKISGYKRLWCFTNNY